MKIIHSALIDTKAGPKQHSVELIFPEVEKDRDDTADRQTRQLAKQACGAAIRQDYAEQLVQRAFYTLLYNPAVKVAMASVWLRRKLWRLQGYAGWYLRLLRKRLGI